MIYVEMYGRLGNQMFRYAFARNLQEKYKNEKLSLNFNQMNNENSLENGWEDSLQHFNVEPYELYDKKGKVIFNETNVTQKILCAMYYKGLRKFNIEQKIEQYRFSIKYMPLLNKNGIFWLREGYFDFKPYKCINKFVSGCFEDPRYFNDIREKLLKEFTPKEPPLSKNLPLYKLIKESNSVCVTIRRGDFINIDENKKLHYVCTEEYFYNGMNKISKKIENPKFFIFSDDIEWVKNNMKFKFEVYYEDGNDPIWEKLRLMYSCKHFVISNSTFSWWAQYLGRFKDKIVVSPSRWFNNEFDSQLIDKNWMLIDV